MKVFYDSQIFSAGQYGGISRYFVELAMRLGKFPDTDVRIVSPIIRSPILSDYRKQISTVGIDLSSLPKIPDRVARNINEFLFSGYTALTVPDIIHETYSWPQRFAPRSSKVVATFHDAIPERLPHLYPELKKLHGERQSALSRADSVICVSESTRKDLLEYYDVDPGRVTVVLLGSSISPDSGAPMDIGAPFFLHVGARYPYKNFNRLIRAFGEARLYRTHKLVSFTSKAFGETEFEAMEQAAVPRASVIRVGGDDRQLARYYAGAVALVFPSMYEGFGIPLVEAMRCGCPIVTSNTTSLPEVAGDAAIYIDPDDVGSISEALLSIASSGDIRDRLIAAGIARAGRFSWDRCAAETFAVYKNVLAPR